MNIEIYYIGKKESDIYAELENELSKMSGRFAKVQSFNVLNKEILKAQNIDAESAKESYTNAFEKYLLKPGCNIALDPQGKQLESYAFSELFSLNATVRFFIGGAYGLKGNFLDRCDKILSLSQLTMSHKIARVVLLEQIFRGLSIVNNHPYHK